MTSSHLETAVRDRYAQAAGSMEPALCCPVKYDARKLAVIPAEVIERDYGCGDPSRWLHEGETVLDLGSGAGKICFIAAQVVGPRGWVIGVDMTAEMLAVARRAAPVVAERLGFANVEFRHGRIQDLALDLDLLDQHLLRQTLNGTAAWLEAEQLTARLRRESPLIPEQSIDTVVSNCVLNLVESAAKPGLFGEIFRVLRPGGRAVISDIVSDEPAPEHLRQDPTLWSGCISGALTETGFIEAFERAGFSGIELLERDEKPWRTVEGIEFRSVTIQAYKGTTGPCFEHQQAVIYKGPFREVLDDDGHRLRRGVRHAVCDKTFQLYRQPPYAAHFIAVEPLVPIAPEAAQPFDCARTTPRHPRETKGLEYRATTAAAPCCAGDSPV